MTVNALIFSFVIRKSLTNYATNSIEQSRESNRERIGSADRTRTVVTPRPTGGHNWVLSLLGFRAPLNRCSRNLVSYRRCRLAAPHRLQQKNRVAPDAIRPANLALLSVDRGLVFSFAGTAHQRRQNPINLRCVPFLSYASNHHETHCGPACCRDDSVGRGGDSL